MYWFGSDATGRRFAEALGRRAREGLDVFVIYDAVGSLETDEEQFAELRTQGAVVIEYHPIAPWHRRFRLGRVLRRDHRKLIVVDGDLAFAGGINIGDPWAPPEEGGGGWRDDGCRVTGPAAGELRQLFLDNWLDLGGPSPRGDRTSRRRSTRAQLAAARVHSGAPGGFRQWKDPGTLQRPSPRPQIQVLGQPSWRAQRTIRRQYLESIRVARRRILIENSYFLPSPRLLSLLERAAGRGVAVHLLLSGKSDVRVVAWATRHLYDRLLRAGIHIHEWQRGVLHSKTALIDDWATVGSYNLDYRSWRYNLEVNVASSTPSFVSQVERSLELDLAECVEIDAARWARWHRLRRLWYWLLYQLRRFL